MSKRSTGGESSVRSFFHHPDLSVPVIRRRAGQHLLELVGIFGDAVATRGISLTWNYSRPNFVAYDSAIRRLKEAGLVVAGQSSEGWPILRVTEAGEAQLPAACRPELLWRKKWNGYWYVLVYDVPEHQRKYRDTLRKFLKQCRLGCLQRSVWITPRDVRPEYNDLRQAAAIDLCSYLFESQTVLGQCSEDIVTGAWDFERLWQIQSWFCEVYEEELDHIQSADLPAETLMEMADTELTAYLSAMSEDPLLPRQLWPTDYLGPRVYALHQKLRKVFGSRL